MTLTIVPWTIASKAGRPTKANPWDATVAELRELAVTDGVLNADYSAPATEPKGPVSAGVITIPGPLTVEVIGADGVAIVGLDGNPVLTEAPHVKEFDRLLNAAARAHGVSIRRAKALTATGEIAVTARVVPRITRAPKDVTPSV